MKNFFIKQEHQAEVTAWLTENIGSKNVRWWWDSDTLGARRKIGDAWLLGSILWLDLPEEELANLTWFTVKWG